MTARAIAKTFALNGNNVLAPHDAAARDGFERSGERSWRLGQSLRRQAVQDSSTADSKQLGRTANRVRIQVRRKGGARAKGATHNGAGIAVAIRRAAIGNSVFPMVRIG